MVTWFINTFCVTGPQWVNEQVSIKSLTVYERTCWKILIHFMIWLTFSYNTLFSNKIYIKYSSNLIIDFLFINSLLPSGVIWHWRSWSTLVHVIAFCLTAASPYLNQCWLIIKVFCGIHLRATSQEVLMNIIHNLCFELMFWIQTVYGRMTHLGIQGWLYR